MLIIVTNVRSKMQTALRLALLLGIFLLVILSFNSMITDLAKNEDLNHAPGQPVRVQNDLPNPAVPTEGDRIEQKQGGSEPGENLRQESGNTEPAGESWFDKFITKLKEYYQGEDN